jgi:hypothetical protein
MAREIRFDLVIDGVNESIKDFDRLNSEIDQTEGNLNSIGSNKDLDKLGASFDKAAKGFATAAKGISGAVNLAAGSIGLLGVESAKVQETLLKVNSALALTTGLKDFSEFLSESAIATKAASVAQAAYATVVGTSTGAMKAFKIALAATGIGLLVVGLGLLVMNFDKVIEVIDSSIDRFKEMGALGKILFTPLLISITPLIAAIKGIQLALEALGIIESKQEKENKKIYAERSKRLEEERKAQDELNAKKLSDIDKEIARNESLGKSVDALNIKRKEEEIAINAKALAEAELYLALVTRYGFVTEADRKFVEGLRKSQEQLQFDLEILQNQSNVKKKEKNLKAAQDQKDIDREILENRFRLEENAIKNDTERELKQLQNQRFLDDLDLKERLKNKEINNEQFKILQDQLDKELIQASTKLTDEFLENQDKSTEAVKKTIEGVPDKLKIELPKIKTLFDELLLTPEDISKAFLGIGTAISSIEGPLSSIGDIFGGITQNVGNFQTSISSAITTFNTEGATLGDKVNAVGASITAGLEIFGQAIDMIAQSSAEKSDERIGRIENETAVQSRELDAQFKKGLITEEQLAKGQIQIENKKNTLIEKEKKKEFEKQKKLRIASATIDMIQGSVSAFTSAFSLPFPANVIVGSALAASVLAFGAVNISKIAKQKYEGSGTGGGGGDAASIPSPPSPSTGDIGPSVADALTGGSSARTDLFGVNTGAVGGASNIEGLGQPSGGGGSTGPQRVYVVESDITRVQDRVSVIQSDSTIG